MRVFLDRLALGIGTAGYTGFFPVAPGTVGSLVGVGVFLLAARGGWHGLAVVLISILAAGTWAAGRCAVVLGTKDPSPVVIDEVAGMIISLAFLPRTWGWMAAGFFLFRLFDVIKPWPANWADRRLEGGLGIMLDDLVAGIYTWSVLQMAWRFFR